MNHRARGPSPLRESGNVVSKRGVIDLVDKDAEEGSCLVTGIRLELRVDQDDERRSDGGEQSSLVV